MLRQKDLLNGMFRRPSLLLLGGMILTLSCVNLAPVHQPSHTDSFDLKSHPLAGSIWSAKDHRFVGLFEFSHLIFNSQTVLIGEVHDNPQHHEWQANIMKELVKTPTVLGFEQLSSFQQSSLDEYLTNNHQNPSGIGRAVLWEQSGWPPFTIYLPIFEVALTNHWQILGMMFPKEKMKPVYQKGAAAVLPAAAMAILNPENFSPETKNEMAKLMYLAHCSMMPQDKMMPMVRVQIAKDAYMAHQISTAAKEKRAVIIAGNGHVRKDWGIPHFLQKIGRKGQQTVISIVEVDKGKLDPSLYMESSPRLSDFVIFTASYQRKDPCESLKHPKPKN
jgi:uncharacterized iron-regulated protein